FDYLSLPENSNYQNTLNVSAPLIKIKPKLYTVTDLTSHDINTSVTNYKYADILIHPGRGILGFKKTIVENDVSKLKSESILDYDSHYFPFVKETKTYNTAANQQVTHTVN